MPVYINQALKLLKVPLFLVLLVHLTVTVFSGCTTLNVTRGEQPAQQPEIFVITPTYARPTQLADLTRLAQALLGIPKLTWLLVEDSLSKTVKVERFLSRTDVKSVHLLGPMSLDHKSMDPKRTPKGVSNRNIALQWIYNQSEKSNTGVFYFADDDNTYNQDLFSLIRQTRGVSVFPVGLVGKFGLSSPVVSPRVGGEGLMVTDWYDSWGRGRKFMLDMAGFAVSISLYRNRSLEEGGAILMPARRGREEDDFLKQLNIEVSDLEVLSPYEVLVWHTKTVESLQATDPGAKFVGTNIETLWKRV